MAYPGISQLKRDFQREHHLRLDQRCRKQYFPKDVGGSDAHVSYGVKRELEKRVYMDNEVPELGSKHTLSYDVVERKLFTFTTEKAIHLSKFKSSCS